jgi:hypothetical protein
MKAEPQVLPSGHGRVRVYALNRKQGARLDGHDVGQVDDAPGCESGNKQVRRHASVEARIRARSGI